MTKTRRVKAWCSCCVGLVGVAFIFVLAAVALLIWLDSVPSGTKVTLNVPYVPGGGVRQQMDVYASPDPNAPVLIWVHGGGWKAGDKNPCPVKHLLRKGLSVVSINYRYSTTDVFPAQIQDCKAAIRYLRAHAKELGINPQKIGVIGASAGGHLVAMLGVTGHTRQFDVGENLDQSSAVQVVVNCVGPTDILRYADYPPPHSYVIGMGEELIGGKLKENPDKCNAASPLHYAKAAMPAPPFLHLYGGKDDLVPTEQGTLFDKALREAGADSKLIIYYEAGHELPAAAVEEAVRFLEKHLLGK